MPLPILLNNNIVETAIANPITSNTVPEIITHAGGAEYLNSEKYKINTGITTVTLNGNIIIAFIHSFFIM